MPGRLMSTIRSSCILLALSAVAIPASGLAQQPGVAPSVSPWFPRERVFAPLIAASREVQFRGSFVFANRSTEEDFQGTNIEAEVVVGHAFPIYQIEGGDAPVQLGFEFAVFSRFFMEESTRDLIQSGFRAGIPISFRRGVWEGRVSLRHISSHIGDDFLARFPRDENERVAQVSKEGVEILLARRFLPDIRLYAGGEANFHTNRGMSKAGARWGAEWDPRPAPATQGDTIWPFLAGDFELPSRSGRVGGTLTGGIGFRVSDREFRAEARAHFGPSAMAQFREANERFFGLGLRVAL